MASPVDDFRQKLMAKGFVQPQPEQSWWQTAGQNILEFLTSDVNDRAGPRWENPQRVKEFEQNFVDPVVQQSDGNPLKAAGLGLVAGPGAAAYSAMEGLDTGYRGLNTAVGGSVLAFGDYAPGVPQIRQMAGGDGYINPLARDGFQWDDVWGSYRATWGQETPVIGQNGQPQLNADGTPMMEVDGITAGQAISAAAGRIGLNVADAVLPGDLQAQVDRAVEEDTVRAINDPLNSRGLFSWMTGLHSEFNIYNKHERESAFNQGAGRWISGTADAAVQWWLAPEVIGLKAAGLAGRSLLMKSVKELGDIEKARESIRLHKLWMEGAEGGKNTDFGRLLESMVKMSRTQVARHQIAKNSTDAALVARTFGDAKTFDEAADRFLALSGDMQAIDRLFATDKVLGDALRMNYEKLADLRSTIDDLSMLKEVDGTRFMDQFITRYQTQADRLQTVIDDAVKENKQLETALAGLNREAGLPDAVRFGEIRLSKLRMGPNSAARMEAKAIKAADRADGRHLWRTEEVKTGGAFGRTVRVWQSAYDYMRTNRIRGFARLTDSNDVLAELDATFETLPMFRRLQKEFQEEALLPGTDQTMSDFRQEIYNKMISARTSTERLGVYQDMERRVFNALAAEYGVSPQIAGELLTRYRGLRDVVVEVARAKGLIVDNGEINIVPEFQALLAEGMPTMDFHFMEQILRLERGSGIGATKDAWSLRGSRGLAAFDALWRPLVLMRLGYTARNLAEGGLRELAAFGTLGGMTDVGMGTRAVAGNAFARWAASSGRGLDRIASLRYGRLKSARNNLRAAQQVAQEARNQVTELQQRQDRIGGLLTRMADTADERARRQILSEMKEELGTRVGVTWEQATDLAYAEIDALMQQAQEIIVPVDYIRPVFGGAGRRSNTVTGFDDVETAQMRVVNENDQRMQNASQDLINNDPLSPESPSGVLAGGRELTDDSVKRMLNAEERGQWDELTPAINDGSAEQWQFELYAELEQRATARAVRRAMRNGDKIVRIVDPASGLYQVVHSPSDIMVDDIAEGLLGVLPKESVDQIQYVRANVYGGLQDLRTTEFRGLPSTEGMNLSTMPGTEGMAEFSGDLDDLKQLISDVFGTTTVMPGGYLQGRQLQEAQALIELMKSNPQVAEAVALRRMVQQLPQEMQQWFKDSGLLIKNEYLARLMKTQQRMQQDARALREQKEAVFTRIKDKAQDPEYWAQVEQDLGFSPSMHTGVRIEGDVLEMDPVKSVQNVKRNLLGAGFYTTRDGRASSGYFFTKYIDEADPASEPVIYAVRVDPADEARFIDVDELVDNQDLEDELYDVFRSMWEDTFDGGDVDDAWAAVDQSLLDTFANRAFPISPLQSVDEVGSTERVGDFMMAMKSVIEDQLTELGDDALDAAYAAEMAWVNALRQRGFRGIRHTGGRNQPDYFTGEMRQHEVFIHYGDGTKAGTPELVPLEDLTADMVEGARLLREYKNVTSQADALGAQRTSLLRAIPYSGRSLNAATMSPKHKAILAEFMKQNGVGRILIDDAYSPSGYQMLTSPDMISVSTDQVDAVLPSGLVGKDFIDNALPQLEREALVRNPAVLQPGNLSDVDLMSMFGSNRGVVNILRGVSEGTPYERAELARGLEVNGYTHAQVGGSDSNKFTNVSELVGNRETGSAYGAAIGDDVVAQRRNLILANDERFAELEREFEELNRLIKGADDAFAVTEQTAKKAADKLTKRLGKRAKGMPLKAPLGSGTESFRGNFSPFDVDGPFSAANQGSLNASLASSGNTVMATLYGFTDYAQMALRKSQIQARFTPGSDHYFQVMAEQLNRYWRNDLIGMAVIRGDSDEEIARLLFNTKQGRAYIRDVEGYGAFKGFVDSSKLSEDARAELADKIVDVRNAFHKLVPDEDLQRHLIDNEVTPDFLMSQIGWRTDLGDLTGGMLVDNGAGVLRKMTGRVMHVLGTLPENAVIRHPFYRARWREEMQRQADLYASQGVEEFSQAQLNAMNQVAKKWALKQTNETLYTIQRLSTPAHMFKFVMPFFPAWASSMRFWLLRMPVQQPQNVARYAMAYNAPESAGWVYDEQGNKVQSQDNIFGKLVDKAFGNTDGDIVIRAENETIRKVTAAITGGQDNVRLSKGSIDMMLQGETFWFPGLHVFYSVPASWLASQRPDIASAVESGNLKELPFIGDLIPEAVESFAQGSGLSERAYRAIVPFGMPTKEKDLIDVALEQIMPGTGKRIVTAIRGMSSAEFANAAKEAHRFAMTEWDLNGRQGKEPEFLDAVKQAQNFFLFRGALSATLPFSTRFQSRYQFYIDEARRIDRETRDAGGTWDDANKEFLRLYGDVFYRYTQSLSAGGSGMSATVGEMKEFERNPELMAQLGGIGDDASFITMATRPYAQAMNEDGFDGAVYAWQMNRMIEGTNNKYLRGGQSTELPEDRSQRELGWMAFEKMMEQLNALAASRGTTVENSPNISAVKQQYVQKIGARYPAWFEDYKDIGGNRWIQSNTALQYMVDSDYFDVHKDPYAQSLMAFYEGRKQFVDELQRRKMSGGSANLDAKQNASLKAAYEAWIEKLRMNDPSGNFGSTWERFFQSDPLQPVPVLEVANG